MSARGLASAALALGIATAALACQAPAAESDDDAASAVVGGRATTAHPSVGYLVRDGEVSCTGTLIAEDLVLTAAHCTVGITEVAFGWGDPKENRRVRARAVANHPRYRAPEVNGGLAVQGYDIALVALAERPPLTPMELAPAPRSGAVLGIGYGSNVYERDDAGVYRASGAGEDRKSVPGIVVSLNPIEVFARFDGSGTVCYGDSGGPLLVDGKVAGTLSRFATQPSCRPEARAIMAYTRVDTTASFFDASKACFGSADLDGCLRERSRGLCVTPRSTGSAPTGVVRPTTGDARHGSVTFDLAQDASRTLRLPAFAARTKLGVFAQGDARSTVSRGGRTLAEDTTEIALEPGDVIDVVTRACSGQSQSVTLVWEPL